MKQVYQNNTLPLENASISALSISLDSKNAAASFSTIISNEKYTFLFEVAEDKCPRYSILSCDPLAIVSISEGQALIRYRDTDYLDQQAISNPITFLEEFLARYKAKCINELDQQVAQLPFIGGLVGYMGYGACAYLDKIPQQSKDLLLVPDAYYGLYDSSIIFDHLSKRLHVVSFRGEKYAQSLLEKVLVANQSKTSKDNVSVNAEEITFTDLQNSITKAEYIKAFERTKTFIRQGEAFQIVLSQRFSISCANNPLEMYRILKTNNPSPYSFYFKYPEFVYFGCSPETFLYCQNSTVLLRAIAGTRPRGSNVAEDDVLSTELQNDEKEMAEHLMLVDLGRNDLGRVCCPGTITPEKTTVTKYEHVMHMATTIKGALLPNKTCFDAFQSCFPAGTVSGAPKIRAMQLLSEIEPERRGIYAGAIGYFDLRGNMDSAIAIRSALVKEGMAHVNAGGGIVIDSQPEAEYMESCNKAKSVLRAIQLGRVVNNESCNN